MYINTGPADKRVRILKSKPILRGVPHDSETILQPGLIEHYTQRPDQLENVCLAEFAAMYDFKSNTKILKINPEFEDGNSSCILYTALRLTSNFPCISILEEALSR